jgi:hypothetical protein
MKNASLLLFAIVLFTVTGQSQKIIISGKEGNRPLIWSDFTGNVDKSSPYFAMTGWNINYSYSDVKIIGDSARIGSFNATLQLDPAGSWVRKEKATDELLKHEQGHFDIGILCQKELLSKIQASSYTKNNFKPLLQSIFNSTMQKYHRMGEQYDNETVHGKNKDNQEKWNTLIQTELDKWK